jgi:hypothetical protein
MIKTELKRVILPGRVAAKHKRTIKTGPEKVVFGGVAAKRK